MKRKSVTVSSIIYLGIIFIVLGCMAFSAKEYISKVRKDRASYWEDLSSRASEALDILTNSSYKERFIATELDHPRSTVPGKEAKSEYGIFLVKGVLKTNTESNTSGFCDAVVMFSYEEVKFMDNLNPSGTIDSTEPTIKNRVRERILARTLLRSTYCSYPVDRIDLDEYRYEE